jgi:hypothetical protein
MVGEIINDKVVEGAAETVESLLRLYKPKLNEAFLKEDPLTVTFAVKFKATGKDVVIDTNMNFVLDRVKTSATRRIQEELPLEAEAKKKEAKRPKKVEIVGPAYPPPAYNIPSTWWPAMPDCRLDAYKQ